MPEMLYPFGQNRTNIQKRHQLNKIKTTKKGHIERCSLLSYISLNYSLLTLFVSLDFKLAALFL
jgi:hypothetical protein